MGARASSTTYDGRLAASGSTPSAPSGEVRASRDSDRRESNAAGETLTRWLNTLIGGNAGDITEYRVLLFGVALVLLVAWMGWFGFGRVLG